MSARIKNRFITYVPRTFDDTGLLPQIVAEAVLRQLEIQDETLIDYVIDRTDRAFCTSVTFRRGLTSTDARGWYRMWVEHWIRGEHKRRTKLRNLAAGDAKIK